ncbi:zinc finger protein 232-like [Leguminivora glycinivorella]|uniref:zinc finger protein 232-like n=1 Tax=Leguminivora glycinivorella TaxID=1035111 RepID=UPI00200D45EE|nr:zinc finger protein 232-like [Leguminivora glycinivorella]
MPIVAVTAMDSCRSCLQYPPDKDLTTPYTHLDKTEIFYDMFKECFNIELVLDGSSSCGICWACVGRLRDASDFKLQVQRSQAELRAALLNKAETAVKTKQADEGSHDDSVCVETVEDSDSSEASEEEETTEIMDGDPLATSESDDEISNGSAAESAAAAASALAAAIASAPAQRASARLQVDPYACEHCSTTFTNKDLLTAHIQQTHEQLLDSGSVKTFFKCSDCSYMCMDKSKLGLHQAKHTVENNLTRIHADEKPLACTQCDYKCKWKKNCAVTK